MKLKGFYIEYVSGLGDYLDEKNILWASLNSKEIKIYCNSEKELFCIAVDFMKWKLK